MTSEAGSVTLLLVNKLNRYGNCAVSNALLILSKDFVVSSVLFLLISLHTDETTLLSDFELL